MEKIETPNAAEKTKEEKEDDDSKSVAQPRLAEVGIDSVTLAVTLCMGLALALSFGFFTALRANHSGRGAASRHALLAARLDIQASGEGRAVEDQEGEGRVYVVAPATVGALAIHELLGLFTPPLAHSETLDTGGVHGLLEAVEPVVVPLGFARVVSDVEILEQPAQAVAEALGGRQRALGGQSVRLAQALSGDRHGRGAGGGHGSGGLAANAITEATVIGLIVQGVIHKVEPNLVPNSDAGLGRGAQPQGRLLVDELDVWQPED